MRRFSRAVSSLAAASLLSACFSSGRPEIASHRLDQRRCAPPLQLGSLPDEPRRDGGPTELPPFELLRLGGYYTCEAYIAGEISLGTYVLAIRDTGRTLLLSELERAQLRIGAVRTTYAGWARRSKFLFASCKGANLASDPDPAVRKFCSNLFLLEFDHQRPGGANLAGPRR